MYKIGSYKIQVMIGLPNEYVNVITRDRGKVKVQEENLLQNILCMHLKIYGSWAQRKTLNVKGFAIFIP